MCRSQTRFNEARRVDSKAKGKAKAQARAMQVDIGEVAFQCRSSERRDQLIADHDGASTLDCKQDDNTGGEHAPQADDDRWCVICHTVPMVDAAVLPNCLHSQFCFSCIVRWSTIKRTCPLCLCSMGEYVIHSVRADDDFVRYYLPPVSLDACSIRSGPTNVGARASAERRTIVSQVQRARSQRSRNRSQPTLAFRAHVYRHALYAAHVGSNHHTGYTACPCPSAIRADVRIGGSIVARITTFLTRELELFAHVDIEFVTNYLIGLLQVHRIGDDELVECVATFVGGEHKAKHLLHELESWLRSGRTELRYWDSSPWLQYQHTQPNPYTDAHRLSSRSAATRIA
ncbi:uncharacterized protein UMAG_05940 [Mycosarcoma maydis]|uniref:RING-type E3 ubiquitin transferase n=1 Tax=Mycosarcoma maydis TaxID=5270 RepID=A0A0D1DUE5_MYCMD|nr:uncharacterized protein UMAG_05940 [Ustilago maydis 521]KIS66205.1 hypothetical protein UMAG_05940 [Ustilago maydis 521]|eukprot:XP_011392275.1 hypothetical protein UMAG_05940 [Ustilago maydis 521]